MQINDSLRPADLKPQLERLFECSGQKVLAIEATWPPEKGTPVFTVAGTYTTRGWTEWTQGFQFGSAILQFDATGDEEFLEIGRRNTIEKMAPHVTHIGVHDHGFNNVSTYGNLRRLMREGVIPWNDSEMDFYELALKASAAVQASRWTQIKDGTGYIASFNGPHSLFSDTIRSLRALGLGHTLGAVLMSEGDVAISLLERLLQHSQTTASYNVYYGEGRDAFDIRGRVVHDLSSIRTMETTAVRARSRGIHHLQRGRVDWRGLLQATPSNSSSLIHSLETILNLTVDTHWQRHIYAKPRKPPPTSILRTPQKMGFRIGIQGHRV